MNPINIGFLGKADDVVDIEVSLNRLFAGTDQIGFVRLEAVLGEAVFVGKDADSANGVFAKIERLADLFKKGILTEQEFSNKKMELLNQL